MRRTLLVSAGLAAALALSACEDGDSPSGASGALSVSCAATPASGLVPLTVRFEATPSGGGGSYATSWSFGDGTAASDPAATRTFATPGVYSATAEVRSGSQRASCGVTVTAQAPARAPLPANAAPVARFKTNPDPPSGRAPLTVVFNACQSSDPDGDPLVFRFDVFDGLFDTGHCRREHTYRTRGSYRARICVTDAFPGREDQCQSYTVVVS